MTNLSPEIKSIQRLYREFSDNYLIVNRRYQRKLVWTIEEKEKLIESILNQFPIPNILLAKTNDNSELEIIDGLQRLYTIMSFIEQQFKYKNKYFNLDSFPTAKKRAEENKFAIPEGDNLSYLSSEECTRILDYSLSTLIMRDITDDVIDDVFSRINTYGHQLSNQDRRQAGVQTSFSNLVREISANIRGDQSNDKLPLEKMPEISIDLPRNKSGYRISAEDTFWVKQGILRSTDLRDSLDEQCVADIIASIVSGTPLAREKEELDLIYQKNSNQSKRINDSLGIYGIEKFGEEFQYCIEQIELLCKDKKLKDLIGTPGNNNAIPSIFSQFFIAIHRLFFVEGKSIKDTKLVIQKLQSKHWKDIVKNNARTAEKRKDNIKLMQELLKDAFTEKLNISKIYSNIDAINIDKIISNSVEQPNLEFKQGCLNLHETNREINDKVFEKIINTICAIANTGEEGAVIVGVSDNPNDTKKIEKYDNITSRKVYVRDIVGVNREADRLNISKEEYINIWNNKIGNSKLSDPLKTDVLNNFKYLPYYGLGLIMIKVPKQRGYSNVGGQFYIRKIDQTVDIIDLTSSEGQSNFAQLVRKFT